MATACSGPDIPSHGVDDKDTTGPALESADQYLYKLIKHHEGSGRDAEGLAAREQLLVLLKRECGPSSVQLLNASEAYLVRCNKLAMAALRKEAHDQAFDLLRKAELLTDERGILKEFPETRLRCRAVTLNNLGLFYKHREQHHAALECLEQALEIEASSESVTDNPAATYLNLSAVLSTMKKHRAALRHARQALDALNAHCGPLGVSAPSVPAMKAAAYHSMGCQYEGLKNCTAAAEAYLKAYTLAKEELGLSHETTALYYKAYNAVHAKARNAKDADPRLLPHITPPNETAMRSAGKRLVDMKKIRRKGSTSPPRKGSISPPRKRPLAEQGTAPLPDMRTSPQKKEAYVQPRLAEQQLLGLAAKSKTRRPSSAVSAAYDVVYGSPGFTGLSKANQEAFARLAYLSRVHGEAHLAKRHTPHPPRAETAPTAAAVPTPPPAAHGQPGRPRPFSARAPNTTPLQRTRPRPPTAHSAGLRQPLKPQPPHPAFQRPGAPLDASPMSTAPHPPMSTAPHPPMSTAPHPPMSTAPHPPMSTAPHPPMSTAPSVVPPTALPSKGSHPAPPAVRPPSVPMPSADLLIQPPQRVAPPSSHSLPDSPHDEVPSLPSHVSSVPRTVSPTFDPIGDLSAFNPPIPRPPQHTSAVTSRPKVRPLSPELVTSSTSFSWQRDAESALPRPQHTTASSPAMHGLSHVPSPTLHGSSDVPSPTLHGSSHIPSPTVHGASPVSPPTVEHENERQSHPSPGVAAPTHIEGHRPSSPLDDATEGSTPHYIEARENRPRRPTVEAVADDDADEPHHAKIDPSFLVDECLKSLCTPLISAPAPSESSGALQPVPQQNQEFLMRIISLGTQLTALQQKVASHCLEDGENTRVELELLRQRRVAAATKIQALYRGRKARIGFVTLKVEMKANKLRLQKARETATAAALAIQRFYRLHHRRKKKQEMEAQRQALLWKLRHDASLQLQCVARVKVAQLRLRELCRQRLLQRVRVCQAVMRGRDARSCFKKARAEYEERQKVIRFAAATRIQQWWDHMRLRDERRAFYQRQWEELRTEHRPNYAAHRIQLWWRWHCFERKFVATVIDVHTRVTRERELLKEAEENARMMESATMRIQRALKCYFARRQLGYRRAEDLRRKIAYLESEEREDAVRCIQRFSRIVRAAVAVHRRKKEVAEFKALEEWQARKEAEIEAELEVVKELAKAAVKIQALWKGCSERNRIKRQRAQQIAEYEAMAAETRHASATVISKVWRGAVARAAVRPLLHRTKLTEEMRGNPVYSKAVLLLQRFCRLVAAKRTARLKKKQHMEEERQMDDEDMLHAVLVLQENFRRSLARRHERHSAKANGAALVMQRAVRGYLARCELRRKADAVRGYIDELSTRDKDHLPDSERLQDAMSRAIGMWWRSVVPIIRARKALEQQREEALQRENEEHAVLTVQTAWRRFAEARRLTRHAARIQCCWRGTKARAVARQRRMDVHAYLAEKARQETQTTNETTNETTAMEREIVASERRERQQIAEEESKCLVVLLAEMAVVRVREPTPSPKLSAVGRRRHAAAAVVQRGWRRCRSSRRLQRRRAEVAAARAVQLQQDAAVTIQNAARGLLARRERMLRRSRLEAWVKLEQLHAAATLIQTAFRQVLALHVVRLHKERVARYLARMEEEDACALVVQCFARSKLSASVVRVKRTLCADWGGKQLTDRETIQSICSSVDEVESVRTIQLWWRGIRETKERRLAREAAIIREHRAEAAYCIYRAMQVVQARRHRVYLHFMRSVRERGEKTVENVILLQSAWRCVLHRRRYQRIRRAARVIEAFLWTALARRQLHEEAAERRQCHERLMHEEAAVVLQCAVRVHLSRKRVEVFRRAWKDELHRDLEQERVDAVLTLQRFWVRCKRIRERERVQESLQELLKAEAAQTIQAAYAGAVCRRRMRVTQLDNARKREAFLLKEKQIYAALQIQAWWRATLVRRRRDS